LTKSNPRFFPAWRKSPIPCCRCFLILFSQFLASSRTWYTATMHRVRNLGIIHSLQSLVLRNLLTLYHLESWITWMDHLEEVPSRQREGVPKGC
jgi:hypothetical protein